ncbi:hypothetical protein [Streptomyces globisporus]|uniref:hypothetical protein n=1 Tax=Streptomyces globisporus TaxID=1908 RepID=UPI00131AE41D|nr:hypothetical protein [Streptomyces globisporus]
MTPRTAQALSPTPPPPAVRHRPCTTPRRTHTLPVTLLLPPALDAFHTLTRSLYEAYARAHLTSAAAQSAVHQRFGLLSANWNYVIGQPHPARLAWDQLVACTESRTRPRREIHATTGLQYDALVLHHLLHQSVSTTAQVVGHDTSKIRYLIAPRPLDSGHLLPRL